MLNNKIKNIRLPVIFKTKYNFYTYKSVLITVLNRVNRKFEVNINIINDVKYVAIFRIFFKLTANNKKRLFNNVYYKYFSYLSKYIGI